MTDAMQLCGYDVKRSGPDPREWQYDSTQRLDGLSLARHTAGSPPAWLHSAEGEH
jgi:hypothetical protein